MTSSTAQSTPMRLHHPQLPAEYSVCTETVGICTHTSTPCFQWHARVIRFNRRLNSQGALPKVVFVMVTSPWSRGDCWGKKAELFPGSLSTRSSLYFTACSILSLPPPQPLPGGRAIKPIKYFSKDPLLPVSITITITPL